MRPQDPRGPWYCPSCGTPVDDLNVADSVHQTRWARPWVRLLTAALALFALTGVVALTTRLLEGGADGVRQAKSPTASAALLDRAGASPTSSGPIETLVAAGQRGGSRYPDGAVDAPPDVATAAPTVGGGPGPGPGTPSAGGGAGSTSGATVGERVGLGPAEPPPSQSAPADLAPADAPSPTVRAREGAPVLTMARTSGTLQMDGWLDDWRGAPVPIDAVVFGKDAWSGPDDLSAAARMAWDAQMLYLGVEVIDDVFSQPATGRDLHLGDSLELQIDVDLAGDFDDAAFSADDAQLGISPGDLDGRAPEIYVWRPSGGAPAGALSGVRIGARATDHGYVIEAALPWAALGANPQAIDAVGASLNVSDNDTPGPAQQTMIASSPRRMWSDPRSWGTWRLGR